MSSKTNPTQKILKKISRPPGALVGPMMLPLSYNTKDYRITNDGRAIKSRHSSDLKKKGRGNSKGALRYRSNKLLDEGPIE